MEELKQNPQNTKVYGNIIGDEYGYLESLNNLMVSKCTIQSNKTIYEGWDNNNIYSVRLNKNKDITNSFNDDISYMKSNTYLYVCDHLESELESLSEIFTIDEFPGGLRLTVKEEYNGTNPFYLLIHQDDTGVEIPTNTDNVLYSANYAASPSIESIKAGFVFFNNEGILLENQEIAELVNEGTGSVGRCTLNSDSLPSNSKYVSVEFEFPLGVAAGDYFELSLNTLLFNEDYGGFVI